MDNKTITVEATIHAPVEKVWDYFSQPQHITQWNHASDDWFTPRAENDLTPGGKFNLRMEAKDGSFGFDFVGTYNTVTPHEYVEYVLEDGRIVKITFTSGEQSTVISETFEAETTHSVEQQQQGWKAILNNFKNYTENN